MSMRASERDPKYGTKTDSAKTNYETFAAADGILKITEFFDLKFPVVRFGRSTATVICSRNAQSRDTRIALRFGHKTADGYEYGSILDEEEVVALDAALKYISANKKVIVQGAQTYTEVTYRSRGGFQAGIYVSPKKDMGEYMDLGGESVFFHALEDLSGVVDSALFEIEKIRGRLPKLVAPME